MRSAGFLFNDMIVLFEEMQEKLRLVRNHIWRYSHCPEWESIEDTISVNSKYLTEKVSDLFDLFYENLTQDLNWKLRGIGSILPEENNNLTREESVSLIFSSILKKLECSVVKLPKSV